MRRRIKSHFAVGVRKLFGSCRRSLTGVFQRVRGRSTFWLPFRIPSGGRERSVTLEALGVLTLSLWLMLMRMLMRMPGMLLRTAMASVMPTEKPQV